VAKEEEAGEGEEGCGEGELEDVEHVDDARVAPHASVEAIELGDGDFAEHDGNEGVVEECGVFRWERAFESEEIGEAEGGGEEGGVGEDHGAEGAVALGGFHEAFSTWRT